MTSADAGCLTFTVEQQQPLGLLLVVPKIFFFTFTLGFVNFLLNQRNYTSSKRAKSVSDSVFYLSDTVLTCSDTIGPTILLNSFTYIAVSM